MATAPRQVDWSEIRQGTQEDEIYYPGRHRKPNHDRGFDDGLEAQRVRLNTPSEVEMLDDKLYMEAVRIENLATKEKIRKTKEKIKELEEKKRKQREKARIAREKAKKTKADNKKKHEAREAYRELYFNPNEYKRVPWMEQGGE